MNEDQQPQGQQVDPDELMRQLNHPTPVTGDTTKVDDKKHQSADDGFHPIAHPLSTLYHTAKAAVKGVMQAGNEMSNTTVDVGKEITKRTGLYKLVNDDQGEKDFIDWYSKKTAESNPLQIPAGSKETGVYGFVEGAAQFATAMAGFSKVLKGAGVVNGVAHVVAGGLADATAFDPYAERLSNLIQSAPSPIKNPLTKFLASDKDDPELLARAKAGLEGIMTGAAVDKLLHFVKAARAARMAKSGALDPNTAKTVINESLDAADNTTHTLDHGPVKVVHGDDGTVSLQLHEDIAPSVIDAKEVKAVTGVPMKDEGQAERVAASINTAAKNEKIPTNSLTDEQRSAVLAAKKRILEGTNPKDAAQLLDGIDFNFNYTAAPEDAKAVINAISEEMHGEVSQFTNRLVEGGGQSHAVTLDLAQGLLDNASTEETVGSIQKAFGSTKDLPQRLVATRMYLYGLADKVSQLSTAADLDPTNPVAAGELAKGIDSLFDLHEHLAGTVSNTARALESQKIPVAGAVDAVTQDAAGTVKPQVKAPKVTEDMSDRDIRAIARTLVLSRGDYDIQDVIKLIKGTKVAAEETTKSAGAKAIDNLTSYRTEMLLSGPKTSAVNIVNNAVTAFQVPAERWFGGVLSADKGLRQEGWDQLAGNFMYLHDSLRAAVKSWNVADNVLDPTFKTFDTAIQPTPGAAWLSKLIHVPGRFLQSSDEFFKQMIYRSSVRAQSLRASTDLGITDGAQVAERLVDDMKMSFSPDGSGVNPKALDMARYTTFTNKLPEGSFGKDLQNMANDNAYVRFIVPFIRTPYNIAMFSLERTPGLGMISKTMRDDIAAGGERRAVALAKQSAGMFMYSYAAHLAHGGMVTGAGPSNPELKQQWLDAGNQPYSIRVGGEQISYRRLEPFATPLALTADFVTALGELKEDDAEKVMTSIVTALGSSVASKTFLQGISNFFEMIGSRDPRKAHKFISDGVTSYMPNFTRQTNPDPVYREVQTILDDVKSRTYGLSTTLEPRRNLFGEPIQRPPGYFNRTLNPFTSMKAPDDDIAEELVQLGKGLSMPNRKYGSVDLTDRETYDNGKGQSPYDRMMELMGKPKSGDNVRDALSKQMHSEAWKSLSGGNDLYPGGAKYIMASKVVYGLQQKAFNEMLKEYPKLRTVIQSDRTGRAQSLVGGGDTDTQKLLNLIQQ